MYCPWRLLISRSILAICSGLTPVGFLGFFPSTNREAGVATSSASAYDTVRLTVFSGNSDKLLAEIVCHD
ncbi:hypothetical protein WJ78_24490 [Burkholderia ubonensis]|nr:hypothetical protein WJ78_24490 [Burkholderia ubonensis]KVP91213.1 hypothetical protein WJ97_03585 [Burkholderia ubonensis]OJB44998.1 hypothetical protein BGV57_06055 [Burkholderia ubonensis]